MTLGRTKTTNEKCKFDSNKKLGLEQTINTLGKPENHLEKSPIQKK